MSKARRQNSILTPYQAWAGSGDVSKTRSWYNGEVSRGHSTYRKRVEERPQMVSQIGKD